MSVIPITLFFSLLLAGLFVVLFAREQRRRRFASNERDSLLPLADETPRLAGPSDKPARENRGASLLATAHVVSREQARSHPQSVAERDHAQDEAHDHDEVHDHDHDHAHDHAHGKNHHHHGKGPCGCESGVRPPCSGCLRRTAAAATPLSVPSPLA